MIRSNPPPPAAPAIMYNVESVTFSCDFVRGKDDDRYGDDFTVVTVFASIKNCITILLPVVRVNTCMSQGAHFSEQGA